MCTRAGAATRSLIPLFSCSTSLVASTSYVLPAPQLNKVQKTVLAGPYSCARRWASAKSSASVRSDHPSSITAASFGKPLPKREDGNKSALAAKGGSPERLGPASTKYKKFGQKTLKTWESQSAKLNPAITKVVALEHIRWSHMTPVQSQVLELLPGLANPHTPDVPNKARKDILIQSPTGTGKTAAFLIPVIEARYRAMRAAAAQGVARTGLISSKEQENSSMRLYSRTRAGALILCPTREAATQVANDAIRLSHFYQGFEVRLLVGGMSKKQQLKDWMLGRRDIVVSTPGRLRDLLYSESDIIEGLRTVQNLIIDDADTMFEMGFRDDIDAIVEYLPKSPERQTFFSTATVSLAVNQAAERMMSSNREIIKTITEFDHTHSVVSQYHTIVPSAADFFPHILRLIARSQMLATSNKVTVFCQTTRMVQLLSTMLRALAPRLLPGGEETQVFEVHSMRSNDVRATELFNFRKLRGQPSILVTTDLVARSNDVGNPTHVIQIGIPSSGSIYFSRIGKALEAKGRSDLVILPWEIGFMTWQLTEAEIKPLTLNELKKDVVELATSIDAKLGSKSKDASIKPSLPLIENIENEINALKSHLDEDAVKETFASLLGYYIPKSPELRCQKPIIVQGLKDWTTEACGMLAAPYVSDAFLNRLGMRDGRTKHFGEQFIDQSEKYTARRQGPHWSGRGRQQGKLQSKGLPDWSTESGVLDERDPATSPEAYRTNRYGKRDLSLHRPLLESNSPPQMAWSHSDTHAVGSPASRTNAIRPVRIRTWGSEEQTVSEPSTLSPDDPRFPAPVREQEHLRAGATSPQVPELTPEAKAARAALSNWGNDATAAKDTIVEPPDPWQLPPAPRTAGVRWSWGERESKS